MAREKLIILGTAGNCIDLATLARQTGKFTPIGYLDDNKAVGEEVNGLPVLGSLAEAKDIAEARRTRNFQHPLKGSRPRFINGIGSETSHRVKPQIIASTGLPNEAFATIIHPSSQDVMDTTARVSPYGVAIFPYTTLRNGVEIGPHSLILSHGSWGHDSSLGAYGTVATRVSVAGDAHTGEAVYLGAGSLIKQGRVLGNGARVGMGAVVLKNVWPNTTVVGNPARELPPRPSK